MNIVVVLGDEMYEGRAGTYQTFKTCESFQKNKNKVTLIIPKTKKTVNEYFNEFNIKYQFEVVQFSEPLIMKAILYVMKDLPDFVFTREAELIQRLSKVNWEFGIGLIYEVHNLQSESSVTIKEKKRLQKIESTIMKSVDYIVALTSYIKNFIPKKYHQKTIILSNGVDNAVYSNLTKRKARKKIRCNQEKKVIVYTGQAYKWKGVKTLIDSAKNNPQVDCYIVGGQERELQPYRSMVKKIGSTNIHITGNVSRERVLSYQKAADILLLPNTNRNNVSSYFTSPLKAFEYMATGNLILASDIPTAHEIFTEKEVVFFKPDDPRSLHSTIQKVLSRIDLYDWRGINSKKKAKQYDWLNRTKPLLKEIARPN